MIRLTSDRRLGTLLRLLRTDAGLTIRDLAAKTQSSPTGICRRENRNGITAWGLIDHARALGFDVALIPARHRGGRPTGTGWPEVTA